VYARAFRIHQARRFPSASCYFEIVVHRLQTSFLISLILFNLQAQDQPAASKVHMNVLEGDGAIINIKSRINPVAAVQVTDDNNKPIVGAQVTFFLPSQGPGGKFGSGSNNLTVTTDRNGRAAAAGITPNSQTGEFEIRATVSYQGQTASATITQTNVTGVSASSTGGGFSKKGLIIIIAVAGGIVGGVLAARAGGGNSQSSITGITITAGTPTVGGPTK
jgi:hypothetical protein